MNSSRGKSHYIFPSSSSSSDDSYEERIAREQQEDDEVDDMIAVVGGTCIPVLLEATTPKQRSTRRNDPRADREREAGELRLYNDYFAHNAVYSGSLFRRRFRMQKHVFERIMNGVVANDDWFRKRPNASGRLGISPLQKCTAAIRMLAYGCAADATDEYLRISESTAITSMRRFVQAVVRVFGEEYLRRPNQDDLNRLLRIGEERGFPGMIGSIDCMHWEWKNCPVAWRGQYQGKEGVATLVLEAVADRDLWIWHSFFGMPGSLNDINVLHRSPVFEDILEGRAPPVNFEVNGHQYNMGYYLTDGIYPKWATFVKSITSPQSRKDKLFAQHQEAARKDVERAFGVLQARFAIVRRPSLAWHKNALHTIMSACIIMHNMIVEDERHTYLNYMDPSEFHLDSSSSRQSQQNGSGENDTFEFHRDRIVDINIYLQNRSSVEEQQTHLQLKRDLTEHIWSKFGQNRN